jgi:uncharacterized protein
VAGSFPEFPYHPDPRSTGFVVESDTNCRACGEARGCVYTGPVYAAEELAGALCPWCIADGTAAQKFDAEFTDAGAAVPDDVPQEVLEELAHRTPGFSGWQQEHWLYHCGDGAAFVGLADRRDGATAFLFRCRHCGRHLAYSDVA